MVGVETTTTATKQDEGLVECDKLLIHQSFLQQAQTKLVISDFNNV